MTTPRPDSRRTVYTILLSVCLFLGVICACLLVALVLIGRHLAAQSLEQRSCQNTTSDTYLHDVVTTSYNVVNTTINDTLNEISVKITVDDISSRYSRFLTTPAPDWRSGWRLPRDVLPVHYDITFHPHLTSGYFSGNSTVTINVTAPRDHIVFHGYALNITSAKVYSVARVDEKIVVLNFHNDSVHQLWVVDLEDTLPPGLYRILFEFTGSMSDRRVGLYSSTYLDETDTRRFIATSKLEPTYARQAFPCFDEPNFKAKYTIRLVKPKNDGYIALSNMDQTDEPPVSVDSDTEMVTFNTSVPMSTYVVAFIVCDFNYTEQMVKVSKGNDIKLRVYATPAQVKKTEFALKTAMQVTQYYVDYFGIAYPLPKLDMIAIPDFVSGAMEHWGLVTYRETALLYDNATSNAANKQRVATVVAHELAHMWFGNLVTLDWWNDLWLNEGFATYMQFKSIHETTPEWGMADQFLIDQLHPVLNFDATLASHPIVQTVVTPDQITEIFDSISYNKGASVLRMLENAAGETKFQQGIQSYLERYKYKNAVTKNLWDELQATDPGFNISDVMDTWTVQVGYPVVNVVKQGDKYVLTQKRFLNDPSNEHKGDASIYNYKWSIPITYVSDSNLTQEVKWFNKNDKQLVLSVPNAKWIKLNHREVGYYRVNYTEDLWLNLAGNIQDMHVSDRTHLLDDSFSIAKAGQLSYTIPLNMTKYLAQEKHYVPWTVAVSKFKGIKNLMKQFEVYSKLQKHVHAIIENSYKELSWLENENDGHLQRLLRAKILDLACTFGYKDCLDKAQGIFKDWLEKQEPIPLDIKTLVYHYGMINSNDDDWNNVFERYMKEIDAQEKLKLLAGLASSSNTVLLSKLMERAQNETIVRSQDYFTCLTYISHNDAGTALVWDYVREHWDDLVGRFTLNDRYLGRLIPSITASFSTETKLNEMNEFFRKYPNAGAGEISRKQALESVSNNINWLKNYKGQVENWLNENVV